MTNFMMREKFLELPEGLSTRAYLHVNTKVNDVSVMSRISVSERRTHLLIQAHATNGAGEIRVVVPLKYTLFANLCVTAYDDTGTYNAVVADNVQAELAP